MNLNQTLESIIDLSQSQEDEGAQEHKSAEDGVDYQPLNVSV